MRLALVASLLAAAAAPAAPMKVMVLYFENHTALREYDVLQKGMADMLITDLGGSDQLQLVEREKLEALTAELKLQQSKLFDPATAQKLGRLAGAGFAVTGAFTGFDPDVRIDVRLIEVATGKVVVSAQVKGAKDQFFALEQQLVAKFLAGLAVKTPGASEDKATLANVLGYSQGLAAADRGDAKAASAQLAAVVRDAPDFQLAKTRYAALLKRLREAGQQRETALTGDEAALVQSLDAEIAKNAGQPLKGMDAAERHFCYRALRTAYLRWKLDRAAAGPHGPLKVKVLAADAARPLWAAIWENERALLAEFEQSPKSYAGSCAFAMSGSGNYDRSRALKIPFDEAAQVFHPGARMPWLIVQAATGAAESGEPRVTLPTLFTVVPGSLAQAHAMLDTAVARDQKNNTPGKGDDEAELDLARARARLFLREGKVEPAVAALQTWLEQHPTASDYKAVEGDVEGLLGVSGQAKKDAAAIADCSAGASQLRRELGRALDAGGAKAAGAVLAKAGAKCAAEAHANGAWLAAERGDCAAAKAFASQAGDLAGLATVCPH